MHDYPDLGFNYRHPPRTSPRQPQNLPRPTWKGCATCPKPNGDLSGLGGGALRGLLGLKAVGDGYEEGTVPRGVWVAHSLVAMLGGAAGAYHGYMRNRSVGWAIWWFLMGSWFPLITVPVALAQGYAQRASGVSGLGRHRRRSR